MIKDEVELIDGREIFISVTETEFFKMMTMNDFSGYVRDDKYWVKLKWLKEHGFET